MTLAERVTLWHLETFPNATAQDIADNALEEVLELNSAHGDQEVAEEMADVYLCILALAGRGNIDLESAAESKFRINQERARRGRWAR